MKSRGHDVRVFVGGEGIFVDELRRVGLEVSPLAKMRRSISPLYELGAMHELVKVLAAWHPDLVHAHSAKAGILTRLACRRLRLPCVFTAHGWAFADGVPILERQLYLYAERAMARFAKAIITVCDSDRRIGETVGIKPDGSMFTIYNGIPDVADSLRATHVVAEPAKIVMTARFERQKDHETLVSALATLRDLPWRLELIGDGPGRAAVEARVCSLGLSERVIFFGRRDDVPHILSRASIFVLASLWEGFPISILEAMRAGLPVVASNVGGVSEAVVDGETGWTVPAGQAAPLAESVRKLIVDAAARRDMGRAGRVRFERHFLFDGMAERTESVYREVLVRAAERSA